MRWRGWGLVLAVLAALCGLAVAGRLLDLPQDRRSFVQSTPSTAPIRLVTVATLPPPAIPEALRRPLRLPNLRHDGSCPSSPVAGPPVTTAHPSAAGAGGDGPDQSAVVYWDAPKPLDGVVIVRGHRLGAPSDRIRFQNDQQELGLVHVLDPAAAHPSGREGHWWRTTRLRASAGCYGFQIDGLRFSQVLVVEFR